MNLLRSGQGVYLIVSNQLWSLAGVQSAHMFAQIRIAICNLSMLLAAGNLDTQRIPTLHCGYSDPSQNPCFPLLPIASHCFLLLPITSSLLDLRPLTHATPKAMLHIALTALFECAFTTLCFGGSFT